MEFNELKERMMANVHAYEKRHNVHFDKPLAFTKLIEEIGEFAEAKTIYDGTCRAKKALPTDAAKQQLAMELADVIGFAILNAELHDIDIEVAIIEKWIAKKQNRAPENENL